MYRGEGEEVKRPMRRVLEYPTRADGSRNKDDSTGQYEEGQLGTVLKVELVGITGGYKIELKRGIKDDC